MESYKRNAQYIWKMYISIQKFYMLQLYNAYSIFWHFKINDYFSSWLLFQIAILSFRIKKDSIELKHYIFGVKAR